MYLLLVKSLSPTIRLTRYFVTAALFGGVARMSARSGLTNPAATRGFITNDDCGLDKGVEDECGKRRGLEWTTASEE